MLSKLLTYDDVASNDERLTEELARQVLGWRVAPDRFIKSGRTWIPKWRFSPLDRVADAFDLLDRAATNYRLELHERGVFTAEVCVGGRTGKACSPIKSRAITIAVAAAVGLRGETL